jgi:hypothetical protein
MGYQVNMLLLYKGICSSIESSIVMGKRVDSRVGELNRVMTPESRGKPYHGYGLVVRQRECRKQYIDSPIHAPITLPARYTKQA